MKNTKNKGAKTLSLRERIDLKQKYRYGVAVSDIARALKRNRSTIYREVGGKPRKGNGRYRADIAHKEALKRIAKRGNIMKNSVHMRSQS